MLGDTSVGVDVGMYSPLVRAALYAAGLEFMNTTLYNFNCAEVQDRCAEFGRAGNLARLLCPRTCGCGDPRGGAFLGSAELMTGCGWGVGAVCVYQQALIGSFSTVSTPIFCK